MKKPTFVNAQGRRLRLDAVEMTAVKRQPGYTGDGDYAVAKACGGLETRLYKSIDGKWKDASLYDVPQLKRAAERNMLREKRHA